MSDPIDKTLTQATAKKARLKRRPGRPRISDAEPSARDQILESATALFCRYGINAIGIDSIVEATGISKTTLYNTFGSKEALIHDVLTKVGEDWRDDLFATIDAQSGSAQAKLLAIFDRLEEWFADPDYFGCPFINAVGEHDKFDDAIRNIALTHKKLVLSKVIMLATDAGISDPIGAAHQIAVIIDGAIVAALITRDPLIARAAKQAAKAVVEIQLNRASPSLSA
ncbi:MAG: TetR/AcrR family transcriptional regulator [Hyphomicrobiales bacterium]|nr:TetR/AcrR family transcriptional regulator [Hyphomicrobiales bacterium]